MSVANTYAKALFQTARDRGPADLASVEPQLDQLIAVIESSREMQVALHSPVTSAKEKEGVVKALADKAQASPLVSQFVVLLARKGRVSALREVREAFAEVRLQAEGGVSGRLDVAEPVGDADVAGLAQAFSRKLGKKVAFRVNVDPSLLAGMKVTVNGVTYDGTLRAQLQRMRDQLTRGLAEGHS
jgi:F-type H+-transporting ATPase subunit delta